MNSFLPDGSFDVFVLGPMSDGGGDTAASCLVIKQAAEKLLAGRPMRAQLRQVGFNTFDVVAPEHLGGNMIVSRVLKHLENADFAVLDLSPRAGDSSPSPNVMYELALVHALGLPHVLLKGKHGSIPFYVNQNNVRLVDYSQPASVEAALAPVFKALLSAEGDMFMQNAVSDYFIGAALVDISAAAGLAVGYYDAFVDFLLRNGGYLGLEPGRFMHVVAIIPSRFDRTVEQDQARLDKALAARGLSLSEFKFPAIAGKPRGLLVKHVGPVIVDLVTTAYAMRRSPRVVKLDQLRGDGPIREDELKMHARLRHEFIRMVRHAVRVNGRERQVAGSALHYTTPEAAPALIARLVEEEAKGG